MELTRETPNTANRPTGRRSRTDPGPTGGRCCPPPADSVQPKLRTGSGTGRCATPRVASERAPGVCLKSVARARSRNSWLVYERMIRKRVSVGEKDFVRRVHLNPFRKEQNKAKVSGQNTGTRWNKQTLGLIPMPGSWSCCKVS